MHIELILLGYTRRKTLLPSPTRGIEHFGIKTKTKNIIFTISVFLIYFYFLEIYV